jgi:hypothetical protein
VPEQLTSALQVSDLWHKIKGQISPNLAFLYGGHDLGRRATTNKKITFFSIECNIGSGLILWSVL